MNGRTALGIAGLEARVAMLERGGGGIPGGGSGLVGAVGTTNTVALTMTGATLTADIPITATPRIQSLGVNVTAPATAGDVQATRLGAGVTPDFPLRVEGASSVAFFRGTGVDTNLLLDTDTASKQARFYFRDLATTLWSLGKQTDSSFTLFNHTTARIDLLVENATGVITIGRDLDALGVATPQIILNNYILSTTGGINGRTPGDSITSDVASASADSYFFNEVNHLVHNTSGSANSVVGRVYLNPHEAVADKYGEGFGGLFYSYCSRRGALASAIESGVAIYRPTDTGIAAPQVIDSTYTGPARAAAIATIVHERNPLSAYTTGLLGTSPWTVSGSRGVSVLSNGICRGGAAVYITGYHANNFDEFGVAGTDSQEWENALVVNLGADFAPMQLGTNVYTIDGRGRTTTQVTSGHIVRNYSTYADANPNFRVLFDGKVQWGAGGATAIDAAGNGVNLYRPSAGVLRTNANFTIDGKLNLGFPMDALSSATPVIVADNLVGSTTGGINVRGTAGDDTTKDIPCASADSFFFNEVDSIVHADRGCAIPVYGRVYLNPFSGSAVYGEGYAGVFSCSVARKGGTGVGIECGVVVYHPTNDSSSGDVVIDATYTGPARAAAGSFILSEHNAYSSYTGGAAIFGTNSAWTLTGSRGISLHSTGPFRGGTGVYISGFHAANFTQAGVAGTDTREWERALVVNVSSDYDTQAVGTDVLSIRGDGVTDWIKSSAAGFLRAFNAVGDANPRFQIGGSGIIQWGPGGASALDATLARNSDPGLTVTGSLRVSGNFVLTGIVGGLTSTGTIQGLVLGVTGTAGGSTDGWLGLPEVSTAVGAAAANSCRVHAGDDGSGNTALYVRFLNNNRMIRKDVAAQTYSVTNFTDTRTYDQDTVTLPVLADVVGTLVKDLRADGAVA